MPLPVDRRKDVQLLTEILEAMVNGISTAKSDAAAKLITNGNFEPGEIYPSTSGITQAMVAALSAMWLKLDNEGWGDLATTEPDSLHRLAGQAIDILKTSHKD